MKTRLQDLAAFDGLPLFPEPVAVGRPNLPDEALLFRRLGGMLRSRWLTNDGPAVREFEDRVRQHLGVAHAIACSNATTGLQLVARALDLRGEVILPSFTFIGTAHALEWLGLRPVFCDIDPQTHGIDPARIEALITQQTCAVLGVHVWGRPCAIEELKDIADRHHLLLLFDAAHAFGCSYRMVSLGGFGNAEVFSFHATKVINACEGGIVATNDAALADRLRRMRNYGFVDSGDVVCRGTNAKLSEAHACMGLASLEILAQVIDRNHANYAAYQNQLRDIPGVRSLPVSPGERYHHHYVVTEIDEALFGLHRDVLESILAAEGVLARRYFHPGCHRMAPYSNCPKTHASLRHTEALADRVLCLPTGMQISPDEAASIGGLLRFCFDNAAAIRCRLGLRSSAVG